MANNANLYDYQEKLRWNKRKKNLPVTLVTGFLGAGKTTLLQHILTVKRNLKIAVAVNDLAQVNIDSQIIERKFKATIGGLKDVSDGCACCSKRSLLQDYVWQDIQQMDEGKFDYLLVETSGVTDPLSIIASLEKNFGKLYRAHLDTVVTVLDADTTYLFIKDESKGSDAQSDEGTSFNEVLRHSSVFLSQIQLADIIILNKTDLLDNEDCVQVVLEFLTGVAPGVRVIPSKYGIVPLQSVLGVSPADASAGVSHDRQEEAYKINAHYSEITAKQRIQPGAEVDSEHLLKDEISSVTFDSHEPMYHFLFQAFLHLIRGGSLGKIIRMKGTIYFQNCKERSYTFNMSGRMRFDLELDPIPAIQQQTRNQLVIIGSNLNEVEILKSLTLCTVTTAQKDFSDQILAVLKSNVNYEIFNHDPTLSSIRFRLLGLHEYGITLKEAEDEYRINLNQMNLDLTRAINMGKSHHIAIPIQTENNTVCIGVAVDEDFSQIVTDLNDSSERLKSDYFKVVKACKCGW